ncbi:hypothetical protein DMH04_41380 [Kibdelosporangium aridum]|uniref:Transmembrane protein n=1 Tax=Kibdelosporangium aridum TaxID=2030 RepID=A0A428YV01_KIBAR|nr:hypothetical protein DMH04_41380 [Kibdelosporangium aridum]
MDARTRWTVLTSAFATGLVVLEAHALREPLTDEKPSATYSAWWRWLLGLQPVHKRRWIAAGLFAAFWAWFVAHVVFSVGPNDLPRRRRP